jgi:hypothetical protein
MISILKKSEKENNEYSNLEARKAEGLTLWQAYMGRAK